MCGPVWGVGDKSSPAEFAVHARTLIHIAKSASDLLHTSNVYKSPTMDMFLIVVVMVAA